jgi:hypothetical protein
MDDLIVLILTLIVVVAGAIGQAKKKKTQSPVVGQPQKPGGFWDLLEGEMDLPTVQPEFSDAVVDSPPKRTDLTQEQHDYKFLASDEGGSVISAGKGIFSKKEIERQPVRVGDEKFSLRKAVIYSEILNRKYL